MRIKNNLTYPVHFSYAGTRAGWTIKPGATGPSIPADRLNDRALRRDFMRGSIDIIVTDADKLHMSPSAIKLLQQPVGSRTLFPVAGFDSPLGRPTKGETPPRRDRAPKEEEKKEPKPEKAQEKTKVEELTEPKPVDPAAADPGSSYMPDLVEGKIAPEKPEKEEPVATAAKPAEKPTPKKRVRRTKAQIEADAKAEESGGTTKASKAAPKKKAAPKQTQAGEGDKGSAPPEEAPGSLSDIMK